MPWNNKDNPAKGKKFQELASRLLGEHYDVVFKTDSPIAIGHPTKEHKFDLVSNDGKYVGECKNYSWTETGNVPSAKMGFCNEAAFYLSFLPNNITRFIVMRKDIHTKKNETLAEYYYRINMHLLENVFVIEIDMATEIIRKIGTPNGVLNGGRRGQPCI